MPAVYPGRLFLYPGRRRIQRLRLCRFDETTAGTKSQTIRLRMEETMFTTVYVMTDSPVVTMPAAEDGL